jgi:RHS repeat-associated protein
VGRCQVGSQSAEAQSFLRGSGFRIWRYVSRLFEQVYDSATGDLTYRHFILAGGARVGVETIAANSGRTVTPDTRSFYVHDEVGSVIAVVTENLGGANQTMSLTSYDAWGKARPTTGSGAYANLPPGTFYSPTPSGQNEGYAGHDNLSDTGLVDMEGRVYDPEVGNFLSPDPNVQYPFSSQGYNRYIYVNDNPLSLSDPSGYFSLDEAGIGQIISDVGPFLNAIPVCEYWCTAAAEAVGGYMQSGNNVGAGLRAGVLSAGEEFAFSYVGGQFAPNPVGTDLVERSVIEGLIGGAFSEAGGGNFGDGFIGAFTSSELSPVIASVYSGTDYYSPQNMATRAVISAVVGGTVSSLTGGKFGDAAVAAAFQNMFNEENNRLEGRAIAFSHGMTEKWLRFFRQFSAPG